jgi:hypothetical protein
VEVPGAVVQEFNPRANDSNCISSVSIVSGALKGSIRDKLVRLQHRGRKAALPKGHFMKSGIRIFGVAMTVGLIAQFTLGTSPTPAPYHQYFVSGSISRPAGLPLQDFIITLKAKFSYSMPDFIPIAELRVQTQLDNHPAVTDTVGQFFIIVACRPNADSLMLVVSGADKPNVNTAAIPVPTQPVDVTSRYTVTEPGCSGCTSENSTRTQIDGYQYTLPHQAIPLSF